MQSISIINALPGKLDNKRHSSSIFYFCYIIGECSTLGLSIGATVDVQTDGIATIATFNCLEGYTLVGAATLECKQSGAWNLATPTCSKAFLYETSALMSMMIMNDDL